MNNVCAADRKWYCKTHYRQKSFPIHRTPRDLKKICKNAKAQHKVWLSNCVLRWWGQQAHILTARLLWCACWSLQAASVRHKPSLLGHSHNHHWPAACQLTLLTTFMQNDTVDTLYANWCCEALLAHLPPVRFFRADNDAVNDMHANWCWLRLTC